MKTKKLLFVIFLIGISSSITLVQATTTWTSRNNWVNASTSDVSGTAYMRYDYLTNIGIHAYGGSFDSGSGNLDISTKDGGDTTSVLSGGTMTATWNLTLTGHQDGYDIHHYFRILIMICTTSENPFVNSASVYCFNHASTFYVTPGDYNAGSAALSVTRTFSSSTDVYFALQFQWDQEQVLFLNSNTEFFSIPNHISINHIDFQTCYPQWGCG